MSVSVSVDRVLLVGCGISNCLCYHSHLMLLLWKSCSLKLDLLSINNNSCPHLPSKAACALILISFDSHQVEDIMLQISSVAQNSYRFDFWQKKAMVSFSHQCCYVVFYPGNQNDYNFIQTIETIRVTSPTASGRDIFISDKTADLIIILIFFTNRKEFAELLEKYGSNGSTGSTRNSPIQQGRPAANWDGCH